MIRLMLSLRDSKAEVFLPPFFVPTVGVAYRQLQDELKRPDSELAKHAGDYSLYQVGTWDDETGEVVAYGSAGMAKLCEVAVLQEG